MTIVTEYMDGGSLLNVLQQVNAPYLLPSVVAAFAIYSEVLRNILIMVRTTSTHRLPLLHFNVGRITRTHFFCLCMRDCLFVVLVSSRSRDYQATTKNETLPFFSDGLSGRSAADRGGPERRPDRLFYVHPYAGSCCSRSQPQTITLPPFFPLTVSAAAVHLRPPIPKRNQPYSSGR